MASKDFEKEKNEFRTFYESENKNFNSAIDVLTTLIRSLLQNKDNIQISKVEGRVKDKNECIKKFQRKYLNKFEADKIDYDIKSHISDLLGIRIVCLYEDQIETIKQLITENFEIIDVTDKIQKIESTEDSFGYKGLHMDLMLNPTRNTLPEYSSYKGISFELQIRTTIQDSWSVLDHKIKYKKSIPTKLKRRINTLAALFELADHEFLAIKQETLREIAEAELPSEDETEQENLIQSTTQTSSEVSSSQKGTLLNAFSLLKIAQHFHKDFVFEAHKVDGITKEIIDFYPQITKGKFNFYIRRTFSHVKNYKIHFEKSDPLNKLNPYTQIRHCLYLADKNHFSEMLSTIAKENFEKWLIANPLQKGPSLAPALVP